MNLNYLFRKLNIMSCKQAAEMVSQSLDRRLSLLERWRLFIHLRVCRACRNFSSQMAFLRRAVRKHPLLGDRDD